MNETQINTALGDACPNVLRWDHINRHWLWNDSGAWRLCLRNSVCSDLNAMHEVERETITSGDDLADYQDALSEACLEDWLAKKSETPRAIHATALQRAKTILLRNRTATKLSELK